MTALLPVKSLLRALDGGQICFWVDRHWWGTEWQPNDLSLWHWIILWHKLSSMKAHLHNHNLTPYFEEKTDPIQYLELQCSFVIHGLRLWTLVRHSTFPSRIHQYFLSNKLPIVYYPPIPPSSITSHLIILLYLFVRSNMTHYPGLYIWTHRERIY